MKKFITTLIVSFCFWIQNGLSVVATSNTRIGIQSISIAHTPTAKQSKATWFERFNPKKLAKKLATSNNATFVGVLGFLMVLSGAVAVISGLLVSNLNPENSARLLMIGGLILLLGIPLMWIESKRNAKIDLQAQKERTVYMDTFVNKHKSLIINIFGSFYVSVSDGKGGEIIRYDHKITYGSGMTYDLLTQVTSTSSPTTVNYYTEFYVNANGLMYKWREDRRVE